MKRRLFCALMVLLMLLTMTACGGASKDTEYEFSAEAPAENGLMAESAASDVPADGRKWIITVNMEAETEDMDLLLTQVGEKIAGLEGYVEGQRIYNGSSYSGRRYRNAELTVRIPAARVDEFTEHVAGISNIVSNNLSREDITLSYVDTESRMNALQAEEARLLELMERAETMADLLEIEARLTDVRYELESVTSRLRTFDNQVDYATIYLYISEVQEYTPVEEPTVWERISQGFVKSVRDLGNLFVELFVFVLVASPYLVVIGVIAVPVVLLAKGNAGKRKGQNQPGAQEKKPE